MPDFASMYSASQNVEEKTFPDDLGPDELPKGTVVVGKVVYAATSKTGNGVNVKVEVTEGEHAGGTFFDGVHFPVPKDGNTELTKGQLGYAKGQFAKAAAAGIGEDFWASGGSPDSLGEALRGNPVQVVIGWQKPNADGTVWGDHKWQPVAGTPDAYVPQSSASEGW